uniref:HSF-type DNA-binding domain-containing protein n=1 Tax=Salix viminalis TaxID=40686 RepID=A0A6N2MHK1_SALVM
MEFANEDFLKDQKHLLKNIHRRKPIHSHSNLQFFSGSDRAAYEEEIDKLHVIKLNSRQRSSAKLQVEDLTQRIDTMQQRQEKLLSFLEKAVQNLLLLNILLHMARRDDCLKLITQCQLQKIVLSKITAVQGRSLICPERLTSKWEPSTTFTAGELVSNEEGDGNISCQLNLTLASSALQVNKNPYLARILGQEIAKPPESRAQLYPPPGDPNNNQAPASAPARANDVFWEQFLTERPGSSENEEASSNYRANSYDEQDERRLGFGVPRNAKNMEQLSL